MANLRRFLLRRALTFMPTVIGVTFMVFIIATVIPGNPAKLWAGGEKASPIVVEGLIREYRLDEPFYVTYYYFMKKLLTNEIVSPVTHNKIWEDISKRLPVTIQLTVLAYIMIIFVGIPLGILSALKRDTPLDTVVRVTALIGVSTPIFWLAYILMFLFFTKLRLITLVGTPTTPYSITGVPLFDALIKLDLESLKSILARYLLPSFVLAWVYIGFLARLVRNSFLDAMSQDFVEYIDARGLPKAWKYMHVFRNSMIPVVTVLGLIFGGLLAGAPITERIFGLPGLGNYLLQSINNYDYLGLMGGTLFIALIFVTINLIVDLLYAVIDPRVRY